MDTDAGQVERARALAAARGVPNARFEEASVYAEPKTATSLRSLTVEADAVALLQAHRERLFYTQLGRPLSRFNVTRDFKLALRRARLAPVRFHDLRHPARGRGLKTGAARAVVT